MSKGWEEFNHRGIFPSQVAYLNNLRGPQRRNYALNHKGKFEKKRNLYLSILSISQERLIERMEKKVLKKNENISRRKRLSL